MRRLTKIHHLIHRLKPVATLLLITPSILWGKEFNPSEELNNNCSSYIIVIEFDFNSESSSNACGAFALFDFLTFYEPELKLKPEKIIGKLSFSDQTPDYHSKNKYNGKEYIKTKAKTYSPYKLNEPLPVITCKSGFIIKSGCIGWLFDSRERIPAIEREILCWMYSRNQFSPRAPPNSKRISANHLYSVNLCSVL
ncbi:MAG: hypothetical protein ACPL6C_00675 [bacterium]